MTWRRRRVTLWRRIVRGKKVGVATFLGLVSVASFMILPDWRRLRVVGPVAIGCLVVAAAVAWMRGRATMVSDVVVEEIESGEQYAAQYCTAAQLQEACDMTEEHYGREYVTGDVAEQCRAAFGWRRGDDRLTVAVRYRAGDRKLDWTKPRPHRLDFYGRCFAGRRYWRGSAGAVQAPCGPPAVAGDGHEGGRAARRKDRRRRSTAPATPGAAEARLADVDGLVTTNPEWPDGPCRRAGRSVACCLRGSGDTGVTSGRSAPHSAPDSQ